MARTVIDLDEDLVQRAADVMGTTSKKATLHQALTRVIAAEMRRQHILRFTSGDNPDLNTPDFMDAAWHGTGEPA